MTPSRLRRLKADAEKVHEVFQNHPQIRLLDCEGEPPEKYTFEFRIRALVPDGDTDHKVGKLHRAEVFLPRDYPRRPPF